MTSSNQGDDDTIRVKRRRPAGPSDSGPRERAEAPQRQQPDEGSAGAPAGVGTAAQAGSDFLPSGRPKEGRVA
jgi:hypothetical protein